MTSQLIDAKFEHFLHCFLSLLPKIKCLVTKLSTCCAHSFRWRENFHTVLTWRKLFRSKTSKKDGLKNNFIVLVISNYMKSHVCCRSKWPAFSNFVRTHCHFDRTLSVDRPLFWALHKAGFITCDCFAHRFKMKVGSDLSDDIRRAAILRDEIGWDNFLV